MAGSGNAIARGSVVLSANSDAMTAGLSGAEKQVEQFGKNVAAKTGKGGGIFGKIGAGAMLGGAVGAGIGLLGGLVHSTIEHFHDLKESIDETAKGAHNLGTDIGTFGGLKTSASEAGVDVGALEAALYKFRRTVDGPLDEALFKFADRFEKTHDAGQRTQMLFETFGRSGVRMGEMFGDGAEGLKKFIDAAKATALSDDDAKKVEKANDAMEAAKRSVRNLWKTVTVAVAPAFEAVANLTKWVTGKLRPAFEWYSRYLTQVWEIASWVFDAIGEAIGEVVDWIKEGTNGWFDFIGPLPTIQQVVVSVFRAIGISAAYVWDSLKVGAGGVSIAISYLVEGFGSLVSTFKESVKSIIEAAADMAEAIGADETAAKYRAAAADVDTLANKIDDRAKAMRAWGKGTIDNFGNSAKQFNLWLDKALMKKKEVNKVLAADFQNAAPIAQFAAAIEQGSKEAYSLNLRQVYGGRNEGRDDVKNELKKNGMKQDQGNAKLGAIEKRLAELEQF